MCEKNVLHCDMSWFNILIFPHHTVVDERPEAARPCISRIMCVTPEESRTAHVSLGKLQAFKSAPTRVPELRCWVEESKRAMARMRSSHAL